MYSSFFCTGESTGVNASQQSQDFQHLQPRERQTGHLQWGFGSNDGAFAPLEQEWKEAKLVSWYQVGQRCGCPESHALEQVYHIRLGDHAAFGQLL